MWFKQVADLYLPCPEGRLVDSIVNEVAIATCDQKSGIPQHLQVLRHGTLREPQSVGQGTDAEGLGSQREEDLKTRLHGKKPKALSDIRRAGQILGVHTHDDDYIDRPVKDQGGRQREGGAHRSGCAV